MWFSRIKFKNHAFLCHLCHCRIQLVILTIWSLGLVLLESVGLVWAVHPSSLELVDWPFPQRRVCHHSPRWATWTFPRGTCHFGTFESGCSNKSILEQFWFHKKYLMLEFDSIWRIWVWEIQSGLPLRILRLRNCDFLFFKIRKEKLDFRLMLFFVLLLNRLRPSISCM